jgi:hypothetical protein
MSGKKSRSLDVLGVKPIANAISDTTKAVLGGASAFLSRICLPAAEEFGLLLQDRVRSWRAANALKVIAVAQKKLAGSGDSLHAHPRLVSAVLDSGSWSDDVTLQEMWGGLLASSCTPDGRDDSNVIFINLLSHLTGLQIRVLNYSCNNCTKVLGHHDLISAQARLGIDIDDLKLITMSDDISRIDRELDNLRGLELIEVGIDLRSGLADITPTALALNLFVRCHGYNGSPAQFFKLKS